jgi:hypothetical protein
MSFFQKTNISRFIEAKNSLIGRKKQLQNEYTHNTISSSYYYMGLNHKRNEKYSNCN